MAESREVETMSKNKLAGKLQKKTLTLEEKVNFLDFAGRNSKLGCRKLAEIFKIGKTAAAKILKNKDKIRQQHENFHEKTRKRVRYGKYREINEILFEWYKKCCASNIFPNGVMLKEEAICIKEKLKNSDYDDFGASDGWLDGWKSSYSIKERRIVGEAGDVSGETITSWMERVNELTEGYDLKDIWNMDESGCFFKALPERGLVQKGQQSKGGKKSKQRFTVAFFVNAAGEKVDEPIVIGKSKVPRCFKKLKDPSRPADVHYFANPKSWMTSEIMVAVLTRLNRKLSSEKRKVILFLDNATCHPESMKDQFSHIKVVFLPKNTTSRLQPLDAGIIQSFKIKYRKKLVKHVLARINDDHSATDIVKSVSILQAIRWLQQSWKEVASLTIKNCFEKCGIVKLSEKLTELEENDLEFEALVREFTTDISAAQFAKFDENVPVSEPLINENDIDWREKTREDSINAVRNRDKIIEIQDDLDEIEDEDTQNENVEENLTAAEVINFLDRICCSPVIDEESQSMLGTVMKKLEDIQISKRKQSSIRDYFR